MLELKEVLMEMEPRGILRVEALRPALALFGIKIERYFAVPFPPPHHAWVKDLSLLCTRPGTLRARVYVETLCAGFDGLPCEVLLKSVVAVCSTDRIGREINRMETAQVML